MARGGPARPAAPAKKPHFKNTRFEELLSEGFESRLGEAAFIAELQLQRRLEKRLGVKKVRGAWAQRVQGRF
jgi:hypothetical protein